jgi:hypothetical protein
VLHVLDVRATRQLMSRATIATGENVSSRRANGDSGCGTAFQLLPDRVSS